MTTASGSGWELRLGRWQDALADVECDALITDPPYSERTHAAHNRDNNAASKMPDPGKAPKPIPYRCWSDDEMEAFLSAWHPRTKGWMAVITDHTLARTVERVLGGLGRCVFAPLPIVETGSRIRLSGDGPSSWTCWAIVSRPKRMPYAKWGTLPGAYIGSGKGDRCVIGGKDSGIMRAIVRDYTRPGDLVCDPCAGGGTTLLAARMEGRRAIGAEMMPEHYDIARRRLAEMPMGTERQPALFDGQTSQGIRLNPRS